MRPEDVYGELVIQYCESLSNEQKKDAHLDEFIAGAKAMWDWIVKNKKI